VALHDLGATLLGHEFEIIQLGLLVLVDAGKLAGNCRTFGIWIRTAGRFVVGSFL
jgi:hypothetical protein